MLYIVNMVCIYAWHDKLSLLQKINQENRVAVQTHGGIAVEIKGSDAHANSEDTFNLKKSPDTAKAKIPEGEEDKQFKPDHFE